MHAAGFPNQLIHHALRQIKAVRRIFRGRHVYELLKTPRRDALTVVKDIMKNGPRLVNEVKTSLKAAGWCFRSPAVRKAVSDLQIKAICGPDRKQWWCKPGQKPPPSQDLSPRIQRVITFLQTHYADGEWHPPQEIVSAAKNHGITKAQVYEGAPFVDGLERKTKRDGRWSSSWRLPQANAKANSESFVDPQGATSADPFTPTTLQVRILNLLDGKPMIADDLEFKLRTDRKRLYQGGSGDGRGELNELREYGLVLSGKGKRIRGYFRPDRPPPWYIGDVRN